MGALLKNVCVVCVECLYVCVDCAGVRNAFICGSVRNMYVCRCVEYVCLCGISVKYL